MFVKGSRAFARLIRSMFRRPVTRHELELAWSSERRLEVIQTRAKHSIDNVYGRLRSYHHPSRGKCRWDPWLGLRSRVSSRIVETPYPPAPLVGRLYCRLTIDCRVSLRDTDNAPYIWVRWDRDELCSRSREEMCT
jgi:hypothetical protein